jgi:hypothetical protein
MPACLPLRSRPKHAHRAAPSSFRTRCGSFSNHHSLLWLRTSGNCARRHEQLVSFTSRITRCSAISQRRSRSSRPNRQPTGADVVGTAPSWAPSLTSIAAPSWAPPAAADGDVGASRWPMKRRRTRTQLSTRAVRRRVRSASALGTEHRLGVTVTHAEQPSGAPSLSTHESATSIAPSRSSGAGTCNGAFIRISSGSSGARYDALPSELRWV